MLKFKVYANNAAGRCWRENKKGDKSGGEATSVIAAKS